MTEPRSLRPKGWTGPIWIVEHLMTDEAGESAWYFYAAWPHNTTGDYRNRPGFRVRRGTLTMEE